jgi:hypothetical protein
LLLKSSELIDLETVPTSQNYKIDTTTKTTNKDRYQHKTNNKGNI